jgi:glycolate oxidase iron-sulfur subunit
MQTIIHNELKLVADVAEAEGILRTCVHCGLCSATCPTYQLLGDELDSPRGRIYLIKQLLQRNRISRRSMQHLDRCLTCRACETVCPSGVEYGRLLEIGRNLAEKRAQRSFAGRIFRWLLTRVVPFPGRFRLLLIPAQIMKPFLPSSLARRIPDRAAKPPAERIRGWIPERPSAGTTRERVADPLAPAKSSEGDVRPKSSTSKSQRRSMLLLKGCVQSATTPNTNLALARLLDSLGISAVVPAEEGCCGALDHHLSHQPSARRHMRRLIDQSWPFVEHGVEAIISTASGCGVQVKDYAHLFSGDPDYADKAARISALTRDVSEVLMEELPATPVKSQSIRVAYHPPCSLQHGQKITGVVEALLANAGITLTAVKEAHLCCGSAGSYSILQPKLADRLLDRKVSNLEVDHPDVIVTGNIGCQLHIATKTEIPVFHWIELLERIYLT